MRIKTYNEIKGKLIFETTYNINYPIISYLITNNLNNKDLTNQKNENNVIISLEEDIEIFKKYLVDNPLLKKASKEISRKFEIMMLSLETYKNNYIGFSKKIFESFKNSEIVFFKEIYDYITTNFKEKLEQINYFELCLED